MAHDLVAEILAVLQAGRDLSLATVTPDGAPHAVVVSYASDQLAIYFGCSPGSLKARNLARDPRVAATVTLPYRDWGEIRGLSLRGRARRLDPDAADRAARLFLSKFDEVAQFVSLGADDLALYELTPERVSLLDYRQGFGHVVHAQVRGARPAAVSPLAPHAPEVSSRAQEA